MQTNSFKDTVTLINHADEKLGVAEKVAAHQHPLSLHRASSVWLSNNAGEVLLQQRSSNKLVGKSWWANTVCGNVRGNESYLQCAERRLQEELGITGVELEELYNFKYKAFCSKDYGEYEIDTVFIGRLDDRDVSLNSQEVSEVLWVDTQDLVEQIKAAAYPTPEETLKYSLSELQLRTQPTTIAVGQRSIVLAPWTVMMLQDARLIGSIFERR